MKISSFTLTRLAGIPVKIHWTFGFLLLFIGYYALDHHLPADDAFWFFSYVMILFFFVVLHEMGHALTARRFGVRTKDVIISPIGGVARLERMPENPRHELLISLAGPFVNVILAAFFGIGLWLFADRMLPVDTRINFIENPQDYIAYLFLINLALVGFNMIPAFPMDGGRVLRSLLTMITGDRMKATLIASVSGQVLAVGFISFGLYLREYSMLVFIGLFVFLAARSEYRQLMWEKAKMDSFRDTGRLPYQTIHSSLPVGPLSQSALQTAGRCKKTEQISGVSPDRESEEE